jgi:hypothetical protein
VLRRDPERRVVTDLRIDIGPLRDQVADARASEKVLLRGLFLGPEYLKLCDCEVDSILALLWRQRVGSNLPPTMVARGAGD